MQTQQINVEYFFRLLYDLLFGTHYVDTTVIYAMIAKLWLWVTVVSYTISILGFLLIVYLTVQLFELRKREREYYSTLIDTGEKAGSTDARWQHIESLVDAGTPSGWREAITEADIMLDGVLTKQGYRGDSVGDKLNNVDPDEFSALNDAWEAHKVRNQIAHEGSAFELSESLALRTLQRYEAVFKEFGAL
jgi:hypothetical protein